MSACAMRRAAVASNGCGANERLRVRCDAAVLQNLGVQPVQSLLRHLAAYVVGSTRCEPINKCTEVLLLAFERVGASYELKN